MKIQLTSQQQVAIKMPFVNRVSIITGKPGTGKTTVIKAILDEAKRKNLHFIQAAPTGKAAKRMTESTGEPSATIHSTLACTVEHGEFVFSYNERHPLRTDLLVIDEVSMVTNSLMSHLLKAVDIENTSILFVGDAGQLPSVQAGAVLRDMLESGRIPHVELDVIHRNQGLIVEACAAIHDGKFYEPHTEIDLEAENPVNLVHVETATPQQTLQAIKTIVSERLPLRGFGPVWDVQVISPVNNKGPLSCESINKVLKEELNPLKVGIFGDPDYKFRINDKVINTKNTKVYATDGKPQLIVNGDIGTIIENYDKKNITVKFFTPERTVVIPKNKNNLLHAYAITCHRFQGSESPVIIIPVHESFAYFASRKWIYTAISRAKALCITVGSFNSINMMIQNTSGGERLTRLKEKIIDKFDDEKRKLLAEEFIGI